MRFSVRDGNHSYAIYYSGAFCAGTHLRNGRRTSWCGERSAVRAAHTRLIGISGIRKFLSCQVHNSVVTLVGSTVPAGNWRLFALWPPPAVQNTPAIATDVRLSANIA